MIESITSVLPPLVNSSMMVPAFDLAMKTPSEINYILQQEGADPTERQYSVTQDELDDFYTTNEIVTESNTHPICEGFDHESKLKVENKNAADLFALHQVKLTGNTLKVGEKVFYTFSKETASITVTDGGGGSDNPYKGLIEIRIGKPPFQETVFVGLNSTRYTIDLIESGSIAETTALLEKKALIKPEQKKIFEMMKNKISQHIPDKKIISSEIGVDYATYILENNKEITCKIRRDKPRSNQGVELILRQGNAKKIIDNGVYDERPAHKVLDLYLDIFALDLTNPQECSKFLSEKIPQTQTKKYFSGLIDFNPTGNRQSNMTTFEGDFDFKRVEHTNNSSADDPLIKSEYHLNSDNLNRVYMGLTIKDGKIYFGSELLFSTPLGEDIRKYAEENYPYRVDYKSTKDMNDYEISIVSEFLFQFCSDYQGRRLEYKNNTIYYNGSKYRN